MAWVNSLSGSKQTAEHAIEVKGTNEWCAYEMSFNVKNPYPGPHKDEVIISCYNGSNKDAWIDDVELLGQVPQSIYANAVVDSTRMIKLIANGDFETVHKHGSMLK